LKLVPDVAVITSMDPDHLDIYGTPEEVENAFIQFSKKIKSNGCLISKYGLKRENELSAHQHYLYSNSNNNASVYAAEIKVINGSYVFDVIAETWRLTDIDLHMGGLHNIENVTAAIAVAKYVGIEDDKIKKAVATFKGVKRRFEYIVKNENCVLIDDYAHHPEELQALINGVKNIFKDKKITVIFQPHLYSRTNDLAKEFAKSLDLADEVILLPIYPARELPMAGVESKMIVEKMELSNKHLFSKEEMQNWILVNQPELVVMAGAGDIDAMILPIAEIMNKYK
jgi:UDP-N-acetylmuramate--alanine ligase